MAKSKAAPPKAASLVPPVTRQVPSHSEISRRAKALWMWRGCPESLDEEIWLEAERQLLRPSEPPGKGNGAAPPEPLSRLDLKSDDVMAELEELFPGPTGKETTSL